MDGDGIARMYENHAHWLQVEVNSLREQLTAQADQIESLRRDNAALGTQNVKLKRRIDQLTGRGSRSVREIPALVKPNVADGPRRKPGRPAGHEAADIAPTQLGLNALATAAVLRVC